MGCVMGVLDVAALVCVVVLLVAFGLHASGNMLDGLVLMKREKSRSNGEE